MQGIVNYGKYAFPIVSAVPAWTADNGEMAFYDGVAVGTLAAKRIYVRLSSSWEVFATSPFPVGAVPGGPEGAVQFNSSNVFAGDARVRENTSGFLTFGNALLPLAKTGSAHILGRGVGAAVVDFTVVPEQNGPHIFGNAVILSGATVFIRNNGASGLLNLEGDPTSSTLTKGTITFGDSNVSNRSRITYTQDSAGTTFRAGPSLGFQTAAGQRGFIFIDGGSETDLADEQPEFVVGIGSNITGIQGHALTWLSGQTLVNQRTNIFFAPRLHSNSGVATTVSNAATVYIEGPPYLVANVTANNSYALWIGTGDIRVGGSIITGGNTTIVKGVGTFFTTTALGVSSNNAADTTLIRGVVGTTSLVANTLSDGRVIRLQAWGYYNTPIVPDTLVMRVKLGGTTVLSTGVQTPAGTVSTGGWSLNANIVCQTTGGAGTVFAQGDFPHTTGVTYANWPMVTSSTVIINTTGANVVEITAQWGGTTSASQIFLTNCVGELLN